ncbi:acyl transferase domain-containing protein [Roridomyces roridus]|uniref:Acyl transferase domain-containing protein n=1 Tax=Roridomyces roridus TaxID=1738132 RepID=A0AAD7FK87_9AGAR|nr:acyl transferase domain-containing protein [Roridomyces roridus]
MSSSGIGGSNGHVVLEAPPQSLPVSSNTACDGPILLVAGGLSPRSTTTISTQISDVVNTVPDCERAAMSTLLGRRAKQMTWRSYALLPPSPDMPIRFSTPQYCSRDVVPLVFVFSGQGPQHDRMGKELIRTFPVFRDSILDMDTVFRRRTGNSIIHDHGLFGESSSDFPAVWRIELTLPAIAMFQMALFDLLVHLGVTPDIVLGHSAGETAVLYASGAAPRALAVELAIIRGQVFSAVETAGGTMAAVACGPERMETLLASYRFKNPNCGIVELACVNSPSAVAISGEEQAIDEVLLLAKEQGIFGRKIRTRVPIHSSMMDMCRQRYESEVQELFASYPGDHIPKIRTYSTLTGTEFKDQLDAEYFWRNTRSQVLFSTAVQSLPGPCTIVEISPHPVLSSYMFEMVPSSSNVFSVARRPAAHSPSTEHHDLLEFLGKLTAAGYNGVNFASLNSTSSSAFKLKLPPYPFLNKQFPLFPEPTTPSRSYGPVNRPRLRLNRDTHPTLAEHVIRGEPIWPAAGFIEMALEFGARVLLNVNFRAILSLSAEDPIPVSVRSKGSYWSIASSESRDYSGSELTIDQAERIHADGYLSFALPDDKHCDDLNIPEIRSRCDTHIASDELYPSLSFFSSYGRSFQRVTNLYYNANEALGSVQGMDDVLTRDQAYVLHPAILDACVHIATHRSFHGDHAPNNYYLPARLGEMILHNPPKARYFPSHVYSHVEFIKWIPDSIVFNITITDDFGKRLCTLRNFALARHTISPLREISAPVHMVAQPALSDIPETIKPLGLELLESHDVQVGLRHTISVLTEGHQRVVRIRVVGDGKKARWAPEKSPLPADDTIFLAYKYGEEHELQSAIRKLDPSQPLHIWITTLEGTDAGAGLCFTRALRREYLMWNIRFSSFPATYSDEMQTDCLRSLPAGFKAEPDILFSSSGEPLVPRLVPVPAPISTTVAPPFLHQEPLGEDQVVVRIHSTSIYPNFSAFTGSVVQVQPDHATQTPSGNFVVGLHTGPLHDFTTIDLGSASSVPQLWAPDHVPGVITAVLGLGVNIWNQLHRARRLAILVTHCDTIIGSAVVEIYRSQRFNISQTTADASIVDLAHLGHHGFDVILSGYGSDNPELQFLNTLLRSSGGKLFLWQDELPRALQEDPCSIGDALRVAVSKDFPVVPAPQLPQFLNSPPGAAFDPHKTYVLLGGIGSLGAAVALYMIQHGARHIRVTSRSGRHTLNSKKNLIPRRMFSYLESLEHVNIRLEAVDGSCVEAMQLFFDAITEPLGGCMILSAILADGLFSTLDTSDFERVRVAKTDVFGTLQRVADISSMDFIIAFSSFAAVFGTGGQTNYCASNGALEEQILAFPNGFSFLCPAIIDSAFLSSGDTSRLRYLFAYSMSMEDMVLWLDDAISKFQRGVRFRRYLPNLDWTALERGLGMTKLGMHLLQSSRNTTEIDSTSTSETVTAKITKVIQNVLNVSSEDFDADVPLTSYGIDSLAAGRLSFALRSWVQITQLQLLADISLNRIIDNLLESSPEPETAAPEKDDQVQVPTTTLMQNYVRDLFGMVEQAAAGQTVSSTSSLQTVLLTGTTGAVGCHLLAHLIANDGVQKVYALIRGDSISDRQADALSKEGLPPSLVHSEKLVLLAADFRRDDLGIPTEIQSSITHIVHNAWKLDFVSPLEDFEGLMRATARLLRLATQCNAVVRPTFSFISSFAVAGNLSSTTAALELPRQDPKDIMPVGYLQSKWVGERLVQIASERRWLNANVIRVGQLTGSASGTWETTQWFPALVQSGAYLGCLPDGNEEISWLSVNDAAAAIVDMSNLASMNSTFHLVHPRPTTWRALMDHMVSLLGGTLVPYEEWLGRLKHASGGLAALRLLDFFQSGLPHVRVDSKRAVQASETLGSEHLMQLGRADVESWVKYWKESGFLPRM